MALMNLASEYRKQFEWRDWQSVMRTLPAIAGRSILDLGCGVGDVAAEFVARGAGRVVGLDLDNRLIQEAESRRLKSAEFRLCDLRELPDLGFEADGIWCSFVASWMKVGRLA